MKNMKQYTIVFAGDSVTDADKLSTSDGLGTGYVRQVYEILNVFYPWNIYNVINSGINGHTSRDLLMRWENDVTKHNPDFVFCMIGINDVWRQLDFRGFPEDIVSPEEYEKNIGQICKNVCQNKSKLFLMTPFFMESNKADEMRLLTDVYVKSLRKVAEKYSVPVIDIQMEFDEYLKFRPGQSISWDRVHPGSLGAHKISKKIIEILSEFID